jgi:hypothetical protein
MSSKRSSAENQVVQTSSQFDIGAYLKNESEMNEKFAPVIRVNFFYNFPSLYY